MLKDLDSSCAELQAGLADLVSEAKRLRQENEYLLEENRVLREQLTLYQLRSELERMESEEADDSQVTATLPRDALAFYRKLPERLSFREFFRIAEAERLSDARSREYLTLFLRENLLRQDGRRLQKQKRVNHPNPVAL